MNIYRVDKKGNLYRVLVSGMNIRRDGEKESLEFEVEFSIHYPKEEKLVSTGGKVEKLVSTGVKVVFGDGKHVPGLENIAEGIMPDIESGAGAVRDFTAEDNPGLMVSKITPVTITSDMSAIPDLFEGKETDEDEVLRESTQRMLERQKKLKEQRDAVTQSGPAGPSQSGGGNTPAFDDAGGNQGGGGRTVKERERETQGR